MQTMWPNKGFISKIYSSYNSTTKNNPIKKWAENLNRHLSKEEIQIDKENMVQKTTLRIWENIYKWSKQQGINFQNIQTAHVSQNQKNKWTDQKVGGRSN